jgi:hypothetical protein
VTGHAGCGQSTIDCLAVGGCFRLPLLPFGAPVLLQLLVLLLLRVAQEGRYLVIAIPHDTVYLHLSILGGQGGVSPQGRYLLITVRENWFDLRLLVRREAELLRHSPGLALWIRRPVRGR